MRHFLVSALCYCVLLQAETNDILFEGTEQDVLSKELEWLDAEAYNTTAFKFKDQINKSPGSITVITANEIRDMGARDIMDVLQSVPGISVYRGAYNTRIQTRGILRTGAQDILMMINGLPVTNNYVGSGLWVYNSMSMDAVQRIEVIRGPASSLYGANAFSSIINVITKTASDINGVEAIQKVASDDYRKSTLLFGKNFDNGLELSGYADFLETDGFSGTVMEDRQTLLDQAFGTDASLAPGKTDNHERKLELGLSAKFHGLFLDTHWLERKRGPNIGIYDALSDSSILDQEDAYINLGYEWKPTRNLTITPNVYYHYNKMVNRLQFLPPGGKFPDNVIDPTDTVDTPLGIESLYDVSNMRQGTEVRADWEVLDNYRVTFGVNYEKMRQKDVDHQGNHYFERNGDIVILPDELPIPEDNVFIGRADRTFKAFYLENLVDVTEKLRLTLGGRYDHYSDFGGSFNPRASIIWEFADNYDFKLLYARAFRAPSFYELYNILPFAMGNPSLDPEVIDSYEAALNARVTKNLAFQFTIFHNEIKDNIVEVHETSMIQFDNTDKISINGFEIEGRYNLGRGSYLQCNYTYQHSYDHGQEARVGKVPLHYIYSAANLRISRQFDWFTSIFWSSKPNPRPEDNFRTFGESYTVVNSGITAKDLYPGLEDLEMRFFIYNLFDEEYFSDYSTEIPGGTPMPGRQFMFEISYRF